MIQYCWDAAKRTASVRDAAKRFGFKYTARRTWRKPVSLATMGMIMRGAITLANYVRRNEITVVMPRSSIPGAMCLLAIAMLPTCRLLYDADGLMADERADFAGWKRDGLQYRLFRWIDNLIVKRADAVITRTRRAKAILMQRAQLSDGRNIVVVSNGKDSNLFREFSPAERAATRRKLGLSDAVPLIIYSGSLGTHYHLEAMFAFVTAVLRRRPDAHFLIMTGTPEMVTSAPSGLTPARLTVLRVSPDEVPSYLATGDLGLAFRTSSISQQAVAPIKVGEYLLCGLPVLSSSGIGDLDEQLDSTTGCLIGELNNPALDEAADWFIDEVLPARDQYRNSCRAKGEGHFNLEHSAMQYRAALDIVRPRR